MSKRHALIVFGGNGFVGSAVCAAAVRRSVPVISVSRSGVRPAHLQGGNGCWTDSVRWEKGDVLNPASYTKLLGEASAVVVSVGTPPVPTSDVAWQRRMNGETGVVVARTARAAGVARLVMVNASMPAWLDIVAGGYAQGKRDAEAAAAAFVLQRPKALAVVLKPPAIYGTRHEVTPLGILPIPLGLLLGPVSALLRLFSGVTSKLRAAAPYAFEGVLFAPVHVESVASAAVSHALDTLADGEVLVVGPEALLTFS
ncbi:hypothetical protein T492DRAFT_1003354 [Pavlovales sp. CCMP2436]|nr:hypothetical protein T492DRAFT_1003354 [Pavlovales sp. CCMP2436]|mmetsp:Transcript_11019/g.25657  ORF Transcript_11019/g.25657 Transcript_11019/m.25657 type:complete len:256 (+) Transcript_11019:81-848(+)